MKYRYKKTMLQTSEHASFNHQPTTLEKEIMLQGKKVDPLSGGLIGTDASIILRPGNKEGIVFCVKEAVIPYDENSLRAVDSPLGRMLQIQDSSSGIQILLVEHLLSAIQLLGVSNIEIVLDEQSFGPLTSSSIPLFGFERPTYWVPVLGPGVSGFIQQISPHCISSGKTQEIIQVTSRGVYEVVDSNPRYKGIQRRMTIEPADRLSVHVLSAYQPDILNNPLAQPIEIHEGQQISPHQLMARPIMRLRHRYEEWILFLLNLRSFALTSETYVRSRQGLTVEEVVQRMYPSFQVGQNEHLLHTAIADFPAELGAFLRGRFLHAKIILENTTHPFRMEALSHLLNLATLPSRKPQ